MSGGIGRRGFLAAGAAAPAAVLASGAAAPAASASGGGGHGRRVVTGAEALAQRGFRDLRGVRVGVVSNPTGVLPDLTHLVDAMHAAGLEIGGVFGPEHGFRGSAQAGGSEGTGTDERTGLTVYDAYGADGADFAALYERAGVEVVVFDIQDVGARFYTYVWTMYHAMVGAALRGVRFLVLDRPNPLGGNAYGPMMTSAFTSGVGLKEVVQQHGMTVGELARMFDATFVPQEAGRSVGVEVEQVRGWRRSTLYAGTGLPWVAPSPNMPTPDTALVYPGTGLFEGTNLSEGRGTTRPFEWVGAPYLDFRWADALNARAAAGRPVPRGALRAELLQAHRRRLRRRAGARHRAGPVRGDPHRRRDARHRADLRRLRVARRRRPASVLGGQALRQHPAARDGRRRRRHRRGRRRLAGRARRVPPAPAAVPALPVSPVPVVAGGSEDGAVSPARPPADLLVRVRSLLPSLPPSERAVAGYLVDHPTDSAHLTIGELASAVGVSQASVSRFCRSVGLSGYPALRLALAGQAPRAAHGHLVPGDVTADEDVATLVRKVAYADARAVEDTVSQLDVEVLARVVEAVDGAARIDVYGVGAGAVVGLDLQQKFHRIGRLVHTWSDAHVMLTSAALLGPGDVALGLSHSGTTSEVVDALELAGRRGAVTVALTNFPRSPLALVADHVLTTAAHETTFRSGAMASRIAQLTVVDCLFVAVASRSFDATVEALEATWEAVQPRRGARRPAP